MTGMLKVSLNLMAYYPVVVVPSRLLRYMFILSFRDIESLSGLLQGPTQDISEG